MYLKDLHILIISSHRRQSSTQQYNKGKSKENLRKILSHEYSAVLHKDF